VTHSRKSDREKRSEAMAPSAPRVFISYSHDSTAHTKAVLALAQRLRQDGVDAWIDQYENGTPEEGWPRWTLNRLDWVETVLLVAQRLIRDAFEVTTTRTKEKVPIGKVSLSRWNSTTPRAGR
jgi:SEFIR domain